MMVQIDYWSDYACPYCYIGEARLKKAAHFADSSAGVKTDHTTYTFCVVRQGGSGKLYNLLMM